MTQELVDFCVTCYEATVHRVLAPGFIEGLATQHCYPFARRVVVINNVDDPSLALRRAEQRRLAGEIDAYSSVEQHLPDAFRTTGLLARDFGRIPHYSSWALVAVHLGGSPWLLHWDVDCRLREPLDWIRPSLSRMQDDPRLIVANPAWSIEGALGESHESDSDFAIAYGFSDQVFLVRRREFARPIYRERHVASFRYPLAHIARTFECRIDAYMRVHSRMRATYLGAEYQHAGETGVAYPSPTLVERWRRRIQRRRLARWRRTGR